MVGNLKISRIEDKLLYPVNTGDDLCLDACCLYDNMLIFEEGVQTVHYTVVYTIICLYSRKGSKLSTIYGCLADEHVIGNLFIHHS